MHPNCAACLRGLRTMSRHWWKSRASRSEHILDVLWRNLGIGVSTRSRKLCEAALFCTIILMLAILINNGCASLLLHILVIFVLSDDKIMLHNVPPIGIFVYGKQLVHKSMVKCRCSPAFPNTHHYSSTCHTPSHHAWQR